MDELFHVSSAAILAYGLGETRPKFLIAAGALGAIPDILWVPSMLSPDLRLCYTVPHSLIFNIAVCAIVAKTINWKIAFGSLLHILIDVFTHKSSTAHLFYPFSGRKYFEGIGWWDGRGIYLWAGLWFTLMATSLLLLAWKRGEMRHP